MKLAVHVTEKDREALAGLKPAVICAAEAGESGGTVQKPWGSERCVSMSHNEDVWRLQINGGAETSMHCHPNKETTLIVVEGIVWFETLAGRQMLSPGSIVEIERGAFHRTKAESTIAVLLEIESPPNKRDLVRLSDKYGR